MTFASLRSPALIVASFLLLTGIGARALQAPSDPPALSAIREADLRKDLETLASDAFRGRATGTLDELRASAWIAERARDAGLEPAGDDGTYFQFWHLRRSMVSPHSTLAIDGSPVALGTDAVLLVPTDAEVDAPIHFVEPGAPLDSAAIRGRVVATVLAPSKGPMPGAGRKDAFIYSLLGVYREAERLSPLSPAAIVVAADSFADAGFAWAQAWMVRGGFDIDSTPAPASPASKQPPVVFTRLAALERLRRSGARLRASLVAERFTYPSVNVVARVRGTDPALRGQHVLFSAHQDHDGVRFAVQGDSIWNGADDNGTTSVALLAIGRAFSKSPGKRSALFVWHGAEERSLLGSKYHAAHPVIPLDSIVAVLNGDMIGRNHPDTASLLGSQPPHRNSSDLVKMALDANARVSKFVVDSIWDRPTHPEGFYFRSDHVPYAARGVPVAYYSTVLHDIYHTPFDEASRIDYAKLTRMAKWIYATGWTVANAPERPRLDPGFKLTPDPK